MSDSEVRIEIPDDPSPNKHAGVVKEWEGIISGVEVIRRPALKRHIEKVPPLLLKGKKGERNRENYEPAVVSLGPYHHNRTDLAQAENFKLITLEEYCLSTKKHIDFLYNKVFEVVHDARRCYIHGSTNDYTDEEFNQMMLRDASFVLFFIGCIAFKDFKMVLNNEYLGALGFANVIRDILLLENQIPFVVLEVLLDVRFPDDKGNDLLNRFFSYLNYGEVIPMNEKVLGEEKEKPLHLLELYRSHFISFSCSLGNVSSHNSGKQSKKKDKDKDEDERFDYVLRNRSFASVMELKAKGIFVKRTNMKKKHKDIKFHSHRFYGELELVCRAVSTNSKAIYLNMIAYEMCPHNPNDYRVSTYIRVMKSLVVQPDDVKELRNSQILIHSLGRDEEVVKMYDEIATPAVNLYMFSQLRTGIERHCNNQYKTWVAELITAYFSSPWKTLALLVATTILVTTFLQTYFTIKPLP